MILVSSLTLQIFGEFLKSTSHIVRIYIYGRYVWSFVTRGPYSNDSSLSYNDPVLRWWFQISFMFIPTWGNYLIWRSYFSNGLFNHQLNVQATLVMTGEQWPNDPWLWMLYMGDCIYYMLSCFMLYGFAQRPIYYIMIILYKDTYEPTTHNGFEGCTYVVRLFGHLKQ